MNDVIKHDNIDVFGEKHEIYFTSLGKLLDWDGSCWVYEISGAYTNVNFTTKEILTK